MNLTEGIYFKANINDIAPFDFIAGWLSFSLIDSIHSFYPRATMRIQDKTGEMYDALLSIPGVLFKGVEYGKMGDSSSAPEVVGGPTLNLQINQENHTYQEQATRTYSGDIDIQLVHEWMSKQKAETTAYKGALSKAVSDMVATYPFRGKHIETTNNNGTWYQGNKSRARFIQEVALPIAYSPTSNETPYYAFIDLKNEFHFRSLGNLFQAQPKKTLRVTSMADSLALRVTSISSWGASYMDHLKTNKTRVIGIDSTGSATNIDFSLSNSLPASRGLNLVANKTTNVVSPTIQLLNGTTQSDNDRGRCLNQLREGLFQDRHLVTTPFDPSFTAGTTIRLEAEHVTQGRSTSTRISGVYLIEMSEHIWDGETKTPITKLLLCRKTAESASTLYAIGKKAT